MKTISILGSTGSIGTQTLEVAAYNGDIEVEVELFTWEKLDYAEQIKKAFNI